MTFLYLLAFGGVVEATPADGAGRGGDADDPLPEPFDLGFRDVEPMCENLHLRRQVVALVCEALQAR